VLCYNPMTKEEFDAFFETYAQNVDEANKQNFWKLSNALILEIIKRNIPDPGEEGVIFDAGGGTGRWSVILSALYRSKFCVFDLSDDMLAKAKENVEQAKLDARISLQKGDLTNMEGVPSDSVDHVVSIYSPISFIDDKVGMLRELYRIVRPGGRVLIMGHSYFNALASKINNYQAEAPELRSLDETKRIKWAPQVPMLSVFSKEDMEKLFADAGFKSLSTFGVPEFAQPGPEDWGS